MKKMLKTKEGISPILATLLLIVIAVAAVIVTYAWVMTFTSSTTGQAGAVISFENIRFYNVTTTKYVEMIVRNSGTSDAKVADVYVGTSSTTLTKQTSVTYNPNTKIAGASSSLNITVTYTWTTGTRYYFKVATEAGQTLTDNKVA